MQAILNIGDMKVFGNATLYGHTVQFTFRVIKPKRKLKFPFKTAIKRLGRDVETSIDILNNGTLFLGKMLSTRQSVSSKIKYSFTTIHQLKESR